MNWSRVAEKILYLTVGSLSLFTSLLTIKNSPMLALAQAFIGTYLIILVAEEGE